MLVVHGEALSALAWSVPGARGWLEARVESTLHAFDPIFRVLYKAKVSVPKFNLKTTSCYEHPSTSLLA